MKTRLFNSILYSGLLSLLLLVSNLSQAQKTNSGKEDLQLKKEHANDEEFNMDIHEKFARVEKMNTKVQAKGDKVAMENPSLKDEIELLKTRIANFRVHLSSYDAHESTYSKEERKAEAEKLKSEYKDVTNLFQSVREQLEAIKGVKDKTPKTKGEKAPKSKTDTKGDKMN